MTIEQTINLARKYRDQGVMSSSARLCLSDSISLFDSGNYYHAVGRAVESLRYSIGGNHHDYQKAKKFFDNLREHQG